MKNPFLISCLLLAFIFSFASCSKNEVRIVVKNNLDIKRATETITLKWVDLNKSGNPISPDPIIVVNEKNNTELIYQNLDYDGDGVADELIFQSGFEAGESLTFVIKAGKPTTVADSISTFGRYVPERKDDFTWENDLVAFRTYGPALAKDPTNVARSGLDCWLKRVKYPIINKWYQPEMKYHVDQGEGYDPYHVGRSLGCGGLGILKEDTIITSNVYNKWKLIAQGPLRVVFELSYDSAWLETGESFTETKRISLDLGQRLSKIESMFDGAANKPFVVGITTHNDTAKVYTNPTATWIACWELIDSIGFGAGLVVDQATATEVKEIHRKVKDASHVLLSITCNNEGKIEYYAGYGWQKAGEITTVEQWQAYLDEFAKRINSPLEVQIK